MKTEELKTRFHIPTIALSNNSGQIIIEYVLMFTVIVIVIVFAATHYIQPSVNKLFRETSTVINNIADDFVDGAYDWF